MVDVERTVRDLIVEAGLMTEEEVDRVLSVESMTGPGIMGK